MGKWLIYFSKFYLENIVTEYNISNTHIIAGTERLLIVPYPQSAFATSLLNFSKIFRN